MISHEEIPTIVFLEEIDDQYEIEIIVYDREFIPENISVIDYRKDEGYVTPVEAAGEDKVYISRINSDYG